MVSTAWTSSCSRSNSTFKCAGSKGLIMRILVTGHGGYIGSVLVPFLQQHGHEVVGIDSNLFSDCLFGPAPANIPSIKLDIRDIDLTHLEDIEAVIHLAALCNDPLGNLNQGCTEEINHWASV